MEFARLRIRRTGHTCQHVIHPEIILESDRGQRLVLVGHFEMFFGFQRLMQAITVAASWHEATGELIDDKNFSPLDHIVNIFFEHRVSFESQHEVMEGFNVDRVI